MSRKRRAGPTPAERAALLRRRMALGGYLLFLALCVLGVWQGPWWQVFVGGRPFGEPMTGAVFRATVTVEEPPDDGPGRALGIPRRHVEEATIRPYTVALLACLVGFFFASYDLVADDDIQLPTFLATVVLAATAGFVLYDVVISQSTLREVVEVVELQRLLEPAREAIRGDGVAHTGSGGAAVVHSAVPPGRPALDIALRPGWGLALFVSSSAAMLATSAYLTFFARREKR